MTEKRNIHALIEKEAPSLNNLLDPNDVKEFKEMTNELRDTWTKKQVFRTETEMRMSVLQDAKYPTKASKYWQCVREQNVFLENLMSLSFDARRNEVKLKRLQEKLKTEEDPLKRELLQIDIDEKTYSVANMQLVARDRMREIKLWSTLKKEFNDGSFNDTATTEIYTLSLHDLFRSTQMWLGNRQSRAYRVAVAHYQQQVLRHQAHRPQLHMVQSFQQR